MHSSFLLGGLYELFPAFGAGDGYLSFTLGHSHLLAAAGTVIIPVIFILQLLEKQQKFPVFLIALIYIPGQSAENGKKHQNIRNQSHRQLQRSAGEEGCQHRTEKTGAENGHIQFIRAVTTCHKTLQTGAQLIAEISQPVSKSVHKMLPLGQILLLL